MSDIRLFPADWPSRYNINELNNSGIFRGLGLGKITDAISCIVKEERNGSFELEMTYPVTGIRYSQLAIRMLIVARPNPFDEPQAFRIYSISKELAGIVTINAQHISYDLSDVIMKKGSITDSSLNPNTIWNYIKANLAKGFSVKTDRTPYQFMFSSDLTIDDAIDDEEGHKLTKWTLKGPKSVKNILLGNGEDGFENIYMSEGENDGYDVPEYKFDNFIIYLKKKRGKNRGVTIKYGKNMKGFTQEESFEKIYTHVYPYYYASSISYYDGGYHDGEQKTINDWACDLGDWINSTYATNNSPLIDTGIRDKDGQPMNFKHILPLDVTSLYNGDFGIDTEKIVSVAYFNQNDAMWFSDWAEDYTEEGWKIKAGETKKVYAVTTYAYWARINANYDTSHYSWRPNEVTPYNNLQVTSIDAIYAENHNHGVITVTLKNNGSSTITLWDGTSPSGVGIGSLIGDGTKDENNSYYYDLTKPEDVSKIAKLIEAPAKRYISENHLSRFPVNLKIDMSLAEPLTVKNLYNIQVCDTVNVYFPAFNVNTTAKCTAIEYDCINERYSQIDFSNAISNLAFTYAKNVDAAKRATANLSYINPSFGFVKFLIK